MLSPVTLSLLIPIYNEEHNIVPLLENIVQVDWKFPVEFVFVDDHSTDSSLRILNLWISKNEEELKKRNLSFVVEVQASNQGKGAALHKAIEKSKGEILIVQDADGEYVPSEIPDLVAPILSNKADVVYGSRFKQNAPQTHRTYHYLVNRLLTVLSNLLSGLHVTDMETCYKAFRREIIANINLKTKRFGFEPEVTAHVARTKARIWELPISYYPRTYIEGKKITWKDGVAALRHIVYYNWIVKSGDRFLPGLPSKYLPNRRSGPSKSASPLTILRQEPR